MNEVNFGFSVSDLYDRDPTALGRIPAHSIGAYTDQLASVPDDVLAPYHR
jgi:hypothetical protein